MREINPRDINTQNRALVVLQNSRQQQLVRLNRYLVYLVLGLMTLVVLLSVWRSPADPLDQLSAQQALQQPNPGLSAEISMLKNQVAGLVGGSIDSKLRMLEDSIRTGSVANALGTLQDLKRDVRLLQAYSEPNALAAQPPVATEVVLAEVSQLKNLLYLTLASISLIFAAAAGIWFKQRYRLSYQRKAYLHSIKR